MKKIALKNAARGTAFDYAGQSWILLENDDGRALCLSKDIIETRAFDEGNCNNFAVASSKEYLNGDYLDNLREDVNGPNAFLTTELDLTTDDGLKDYGTCTVTIFLLTVDQYRRNRDVIPNADDWWWLSTAFSTKSNGYESLARGVFIDGTLNRDVAYNGYYGLRPACYLDSDLLISIEDDEATDDVTPEHAGENRATAFRYEATPICRASFPSTLDEDDARCTVEVTVYRLNAVAVTAFLLDGPETLLRHIGLDEQDTYTTKHEIDDLVTVVHITREEAPAWQH